MSSGFVADASLGIAWVAPRQADQVTEQLRLDAMAGAAIVVPAFWSLEVSNGLLMLYRRGKISEATWMDARRKVSRIDLVLDDEASRLAFTDISDLAVKYSLTTYGATYLELAIRRGIPLATRDTALSKAARKCGVKTLL